MNIDDILASLFGGGQTAEAGTTPGEITRQALAGAPPSAAAPLMFANPAAAGALKSAPMAPAVATAADAQPSMSPGIPRQSINPLASFSRGYQKGGLIGAFGNQSEEENALARSEAEKAAATANDRARNNLTAKFLMSKGGYSAEDAAALIANPPLLKDVVSTMLKPKAAERPIVMGQRLVTPGGQVLADFSAAQGAADTSTPEGRSAAAAKYGLEPSSDAYKSYVLTGRLPREDQQRLTATDKKAILEADEMEQTNRAGITALKEAQALNPKAYEGMLAEQRAWLANNLLPWATPEAEATVNFDNAVTGQALTQLKAIFGGAPTEGERKILLDLQGASNQPMGVRKDILRRALAAAEARLGFNQERARQLRGGTFYQPGGGPSGGGAPPASPSTAVPNAGDVVDGYRFKGGDPGQQENWERL